MRETIVDPFLLPRCVHFRTVLADACTQSMTERCCFSENMRTRLLLLFSLMFCTFLRPLCSFTPAAKGGTMKAPCHTQGCWQMLKALLDRTSVFTSVRGFVGNVPTPPPPKHASGGFHQIVPGVLTEHRAYYIHVELNVSRFARDPPTSVQSFPSTLGGTLEL